MFVSLEPLTPERFEKWGGGPGPGSQIYRVWDRPKDLDQGTCQKKLGGGCEYWKVGGVWPGARVWKYIFGLFMDRPYMYMWNKSHYKRQDSSAGSTLEWWSSCVKT